MRPEPKSHGGLPSHAEARAIAERARVLRAQLLRGLFRAAWSRIASRPRGVSAASLAGRMPHAGA